MNKRHIGKWALCDVPECLMPARLMKCFTCDAFTHLECSMSVFGYPLEAPEEYGVTENVEVFHSQQCLDVFLCTGAQESNVPLAIPVQNASALCDNTPTAEKCNAVSVTKN